MSIREYSNGEVTIVWNSALCIHSEKCVNGLPGVFNINSSPWIDPTKGSSEEIVEQVSKCPSGALMIKKEQVAVDADESPNEVEVNFTKNGPIMLSGNFKLIDGDGNLIDSKSKAFLCRCGNSANKPFCDGTHKKVEFIG